MIKVQKYTPEVYYKNSRDFQAVGRVCDVLYNYILMNIDNMTGLPISDNTNPRMLELALLTLGFDRHHNYTNVDLVKLSEIFKSIMRVKGTRKAIEEIVFLLLRSQSIEEEAFILNIHTELGRTRTKNDDENEMYVVELFVSNKLQDVVLIEDVFDYILPAGFVYKIHLSSSYRRDVTTQTSISNEAKIYGLGINANKVFGQVFDSTNEDEEPLIAIPKTSKTYTGVVANSEAIEDYSDEWEYKKEPESEENNNG